MHSRVPWPPIPLHIIHRFAKPSRPAAWRHWSRYLSGLGTCTRRGLFFHFHITSLLLQCIYHGFAVPTKSQDFHCLSEILLKNFNALKVWINGRRSLELHRFLRFFEHVLLATFSSTRDPIDHVHLIRISVNTLAPYMYLQNGVRMACTRGWTWIRTLHAHSGASACLHRSPKNRIRADDPSLDSRFSSLFLIISSPTEARGR